jgi:hypothetical protein
MASGTINIGDVAAAGLTMLDGVLQPMRPAKPAPDKSK